VGDRGSWGEDQEKTAAEAALVQVAAADFDYPSLFGVSFS
jgi:hypothetical protein